MNLRRLRDLPLLLLAGLLLLPVLAVLGSWLSWNAASGQILRRDERDRAARLRDHQRAAVPRRWAWALPWSGRRGAAAVTLFDFPGRRGFEWALLLPLAMPAYVVAYAYTDFLQFSGPLQAWLRGQFGLEGRVFPEVRNLPGAIFVFVFSSIPTSTCWCARPSPSARRS